MCPKQNGKNDTQSSPNITNNYNTEPSKKTVSHIVIPYTQGLCKSINNICIKYGIEAPIQNGRTLKNIM